MIDLNIFTILYLFLRLSPFIVVCFFVLNSLFNQDFRGIVYIHGLIASCFLSALIYTGIVVYITDKGADQTPKICSLVSFSNEPNHLALPIGQNVLGFTFFYLLYPIIKKKIVLVNLITVIFFPLLIIFDFIWNITSDCYNILQLFVSLVLGGGLGTLLAYLIDESKISSFQYFYTGEAGGEMCSVPSKQTFRCNVYQSGKLVGSTLSG